MFQVTDSGGSIFVHAFGAYFGLAVSLALGHGKAISQGPRLEKEGSSYTSDTFAMIGKFLSMTAKCGICMYVCVCVCVCMCVCVVGLGGLGVTCSPRDPRFAGSNPAEIDGFIRT